MDKEFITRILNQAKQEITFHLKEEKKILFEMERSSAYKNSPCCDSWINSHAKMVGKLAGNLFRIQEELMDILATQGTP